MSIRLRPLTGPIRQFISDRDLTVTELAKRIGYDRTQVSLVINGTRPMTWEMAARLALELGVKPDAIVEPAVDPETAA